MADRKRRRIDKTGKASVTSNEETESTTSGTVHVSKQRYDWGLYTGEWDPKTKEPNGEGEWSKDGIVRYIGGWKQGIWNGNGVVFDEAGKRSCEGNVLDGEFHGRCKYYDENDETVFQEVYVVYGEEREDISTEEEFATEAEKARLEREIKETQESKPVEATSIVSFSMTFTKDSPIMCAPIIGLFPRYEAVPAKMLNGANFTDLDDDEVPTPTNLEPGKTRKDWLKWVRKFYPRKI